MTGSTVNLQDVPVLVTGGAGFIGSHLVDALVAHGSAVRVLDSFATGREENLATSRSKIEILRGDIRDLEICRAACAGERFVFHLAALGSVPRSMENPALTFEVNATGTCNVLAAARDAGAERVIYASSSSVYGDSTTLPKREGEEGRPLSPYALSKVEGERLGELFFRLFGLGTVGLRYFNVYGPRQDPSGPYAAVVPRFLAALSRGEGPTIYGDGEQGRDFTFVSDVVAANLAALGCSGELLGRAFNVAPGRRTTVNELAGTLCGVFPGSPRPTHAAPRAGDIRDSQADASLFRSLSGFIATVPLDRGLNETASWFLSRRVAPSA